MNKSNGLRNYELGHWGELRAADFLKDAGYTIVEMNYHTRFGEIDIIAQNDKSTAFVEVKLRKNARFAEAREYVTRAKQVKIKMAAEQWLSCNGGVLQPQFDVIEIYAPQAEKTEYLKINHIENAF